MASYVGIYTPEEQGYNAQPCIVASDAQVPNSIVRHRLGISQISEKANKEVLRKALDLPDGLLHELSIDQKAPPPIDDELHDVDWNEDDEDMNVRRKHSMVTTILHTQRDRRRKHEDYTYDYDNTEALSLDEIIEEIRTNVGKELKDDDVMLITELMLVISAHKQDQVMNIFDELTHVQLIKKFGGVPKLVQALQEIQKAFEQVAMKANVASIETVIDVLLEKDNTYRVAVELSNSFNDYAKKHKQHGKRNLGNTSDEVTEHDQALFHILINDRISRMSTPALTALINDLKAVRHLDTSKLDSSHDGLVKFVSEQLNHIFVRAHFDGIRSTFQSMTSTTGHALSEFITQTESSLKAKLTESEKLTVESFIHAYLTSLDDGQLKTIYERLAQQGTLKRYAATKDMNQSITLGLVQKIESDGLGTVIEHIKQTHLGTDELTQGLICMNKYIQTQPPVSIEQILNQLSMAYFIETRELAEHDVQRLASSAQLYSLVALPLPENGTQDDYSTFVEQLKAPVLRVCLQRILNEVQEHGTNLKTTPSQFYNQCVRNLLDELRQGSEEFNRSALFRQMNEKLKKNKDMIDRVYRQMLKEKLISVDAKVKTDTEKKKLAVIINVTEKLFDSSADRTKQAAAIAALEKNNIVLPDRVKQWYTSSSRVQASTSKLKNQPANRRNDKPTQPANPRSIASTHPKAEKSPRVPPNATSDRSAPVEAVVPAKPTTETKAAPLQPLPDVAQPQKLITEEIPLMNAHQTHLSTAENDSPVSNQPPTIFSSTSTDPAVPQAAHDLPQQLTRTDELQANPTLNDAQEQDPALLHNPTVVLAESEHKAQLVVANMSVQHVDDVPYERTKAQRLLAKAIPPTGARQTLGGETVVVPRSWASLVVSTAEPTVSTADIQKLSESRHPSLLTESTSAAAATIDTTDHKTLHSKEPRRVANKPPKPTENVYTASFTNALRDLFSRPAYDSAKLRKIHDELISAGHISPLNEFYRSTNDAIRVTLDHCLTYGELIKWTLSLLQTSHKPVLIDFGHDLYAIAIALDQSLTQRIDEARCITEIQDSLRPALQAMTDSDLREINSYLNAAQLEKLVSSSKKLNVTSKDRMRADLYSFLLHLIQACHTFQPANQPLQAHIREVAETFKSRAVADLAGHLDETEKRLSTAFNVTFFGVSKRLQDSRFSLTK